MRNCPQNINGSAEAPPSLSMVGMLLELTLLLLLVWSERNTLLLRSPPGCDPLFSFELPRRCVPDPEKIPLTKLDRREAVWQRLAVDKKPRPGTKSLAVTLATTAVPGIDDIDAISRSAGFSVVVIGGGDGMLMSIGCEL